jgi:hypothetical protein
MFTKIKAVKVAKLIVSGSVPHQIGNIRYMNINQKTPLGNGVDSLPTARPLFYNISQYPAVNEVVYVVTGPGSSYNERGSTNHYYLPPLNIYGSPNHNAQPNELTGDEMFNFSETGINNDFKAVGRISPLRPYDGDVMIEGRYGNSIRFGSTVKDSDNNPWSREGMQGNPITIIRNGQYLDVNNPPYEHVTENINFDDSSVYLCSNQQITHFQKAGIGNKEHELSYKHMLT